jgi:hypothetical protein
MITVEVTGGHHSLAQFQTETLPGIGDILTIVTGSDVAECYTVIARGFAIHGDIGVDQASVAYVTLRVRKSTNAEEASFRGR